VEHKSQYTTAIKLHKKDPCLNVIPLLHVSINLRYFIIVFRIFISHFYISYYNVNEISYFKEIFNCVSKKPFELQPEDGFIKEPNMSLV